MLPIQKQRSFCRKGWGNDQETVSQAIIAHIMATTQPNTDPSRPPVRGGEVSAGRIKKAVTPYRMTASIKCGGRARTLDLPFCSRDIWLAFIAVNSWCAVVYDRTATFASGSEATRLFAVFRDLGNVIPWSTTVANKKSRRG